MDTGIFSIWAILTRTEGTGNIYMGGRNSNSSSFNGYLTGGHYITYTEIFFK